MSDLYAVAGAKFFIGGPIATKKVDFIETDFTGEVWTEVDGWETAGAYGDTATLITRQLINRNRDIKDKGTRNAGGMQNTFAIVSGDPGQEAMAAAERANHNYTFKIEYDDQPPGGTTKTIHKFIGLVMSWQRQNGQANTGLAIQATIEINSNIVETPAA